MLGCQGPPSRTWTCQWVSQRLAEGRLYGDIPAVRKTAGFYGHMATKGCSKCLKSFSRNSDNRVEYSGFEEEDPLRSQEEHCRWTSLQHGGHYPCPCGAHAERFDDIEYV
ncbi:hypothetical protein Bbelb_283080 [Branchiostoma belcheri]|nr:hypothetical protein Bbelb_283080 [Branchiostoma belcheri]